MEKWDENEYTVIFKAINQALSANDQERYRELKNNLLELEKRQCQSDDSSSSDDLLYSQPSKSTGLLDVNYEAQVDSLIKCNTIQYDAKVSILVLGEHLSGKTLITNFFVYREIKPYENTNG